MSSNYVPIRLQTCDHCDYCIATASDICDIKLYFCKKLQRSVPEKAHCGFFTFGVPEFIEKAVNDIYAQLGISRESLSAQNATAFYQRMWNEAYGIPQTEKLNELNKED